MGIKITIETDLDNDDERDMVAYIQIDSRKDGLKVKEVIELPPKASVVRELDVDDSVYIIQSEGSLLQDKVAPIRVY